MLLKLLQRLCLLLVFSFLKPNSWVVMVADPPTHDVSETGITKVVKAVYTRQFWCPLCLSLSHFLFSVFWVFLCACLIMKFKRYVCVYVCVYGTGDCKLHEKSINQQNHFFELQLCKKKLKYNKIQSAEA